VKESNISSEKIKEVGNTVANIRVSGVKPP